MHALMKLTGTAAMALWLAAPLAAQEAPPQADAPTPGPGMMPHGGPPMGMMREGPAAMARTPVAVVLEHREQLELTADQVDALEALEARLEEENGPRWARLEEAFGGADPRTMTAEERRAHRDRMQELAPVHQEIRTANRAAMEEARDLLTGVQRAALPTLMRRGPDGRRGPGIPGMQGRRHGGGVGAWQAGHRQGWARGWHAGRRARVRRPG